MRRPYFRAVLASALLCAAQAFASTAVGPVTSSPGLPGGVQAHLGITATEVVKLGPSVLVRIIVQSPGTGGTLTLNDTDTVGHAASGNQILSLTNAQLTAGQQIVLEWPIGTGIVVSSVPTGGGSVSISFS